MRRLRSRSFPWQGRSWGVALRYSNRERVAYPVGSREAAERELLRPRPPDPNPDPVDGRSLRRPVTRCPRNIHRCVASFSRSSITMLPVQRRDRRDNLHLDEPQQLSPPSTAQLLGLFASSPARSAASLEGGRSKARDLPCSSQSRVLAPRPRANRFRFLAGRNIS